LANVDSSLARKSKPSGKPTCISDRKTRSSRASRDAPPNDDHRQLKKETLTMKTVITLAAGTAFIGALMLTPVGLPPAHAGDQPPGKAAESAFGPWMESTSPDQASFFGNFAISVENATMRWNMQPKSQCYETGTERAYCVVSWLAPNAFPGVDMMVEFYISICARFERDGASNLPQPHVCILIRRDRA
jgi:hypothetical protein